jgi:hypothetical protein
MEHGNPSRTIARAYSPSGAMPQRSGAPFQTEFRFLQPNESVVWARVNSAAMSDGLARTVG